MSVRVGSMVWYFDYDDFEVKWLYLIHFEVQGVVEVNSWDKNLPLCVMP